jgi:MFS family permease
VAVGALLMGLVASRIARRIGRRAAVRSAIAGTSCIGLLFVTAGAAPVLILDAFLIGLSGSLLVIIVQADLAGRHPAHRSVALVDINLACSSGTIVAASGVGLASRTL